MDEQKTANFGQMRDASNTNDEENHKVITINESTMK